jgi:hypothetical protein
LIVFCRSVTSPQRKQGVPTTRPTRTTRPQRKQGDNVRRRRFAEHLETRQLMAVAPFSREDLGYFTPANTNLVVTTSSAQINLLANSMRVLRLLPS